jgi:hypothetical protein
MIDHITHNDKILAIIIRHNYSCQGINFFTPDDFSQQLAYMNHPKGKVIQPHIHNIVKREVLFTKEVLVIKKGKIRADFYTDEQEYICSNVLEAGDIILLAAGGHGFEILEDTEMYEIKQGPYAGENDKTRFIPKKRDSK